MDLFVIVLLYTYTLLQHVKLFDIHTITGFVFCMIFWIINDFYTLEIGYLIPTNGNSPPLKISKNIKYQY